MKDPLRVLIVEDSKDDAELLQIELKRGGFKLKPKRVETEKEMKKSLDEKNWDLIILDYKLPKFSGIRALEIAMEKGLDIPLILVSGFVGEEKAVEAMRKGAHDYIMKDNLARLVPAVKRELKDAEIRRERKRNREMIRQLNSLLDSISKINQVIVKAENLEKMFQEAGDLLLQTKKYRDCTFSLINEDNGRITPFVTSGEGGFIKGWSISREGKGRAPQCIKKTVKSGKIQIIDTKSCNKCSYYKKRGKYICVMVPMKRENKLIGILSISLEEGVQIEHKWKELLLEVAEDMAFGWEKLKERKELRDNENYLRSIFKAAPVGIGTVYNRRFKTVNQNLFEHLGYGEEELIGKDVRLIYPSKEEYEYVGSEIYEQIRKYGTGTVETRVRRKDGTIIDVVVSMAPVSNSKPDDEITFAVLDITRQKRAQEDLIETEKKLRKAQKIARLGFYSWEFRGKDSIWDSSEILDDIFGIDDKYKKNIESWMNIIHQEDRGEVEKLFMSAMAEKKQRFGLEYRIIRVNDKKERWVESIGAFEYNKGKPKRLVGTIRDITERKKAEEKLLENEEKLRNIVENSTNLFFSHNTRREITYLSPQSIRFLQCKPEEGMTNWTDFLSDNPINERGINLTLKAIETGKVQEPFEIELLGKKGKKIFVEVNEAPILKNGRTVSVVGAMTDITERKRAQERLNTAFEGTIKVISDILELRDAYTAGHQRRVAQLAVEIARGLDLAQDRIKGLEVASSIHDLGKIVIPSQVLSKPTRLTELEFMYIKQHPTVGYQVLKGVTFPWPLAEIIYQHHEALNGSGYPRGLSGEEIMLEARILTVADVVEAMSSHRPYRKARGLEVALQEIKDRKGELYDPDVVDACLEVFKSGFEFMEVESTVLES